MGEKKGRTIILIIALLFWVFWFYSLKTEMGDDVINPNIFRDFRNIEASCRVLLEKTDLTAPRGVPQKCREFLIKRAVCESSAMRGECSPRAFFFFTKELGMRVSPLSKRYRMMHPRGE